MILIKPNYIFLIYCSLQKYPIDDDVPPSYAPKKEIKSDITSANVDVVCVYSHVLHM